LLEIGADAVIFSVDYPYESNHEAVAGLEWFAKHMN
jgi:2,3-dihydroxybenzoate decarboxylase